MAKTILAISGKPGLYELISRGKGSLIVEGLLDHKRIPAFAKDRVTSLADICMYTDDEDKPLGEILVALRDMEKGKKTSLDYKKAIIATNILFFNNEEAEGAAEGFRTKETWFYRLDMPEGYKHFSKTKPMRLEHCKPIVDWWNNRVEIVNEDSSDEKSRCFNVEKLVELDCNFDQCKFPKDEEEVLRPEELLKQYHEQRTALDAKIDAQLREIENLLGIEINNE